MSKEMDILKHAIASKTNYTETLQSMQMANTPEEQQKGLRGAPPNTSMTFPNTASSFTTKGMDYNINISKFDNNGSLVQSFANVPPGVDNLPMGNKTGNVIETPAHEGYQTTGYINKITTPIRKRLADNLYPVSYSGDPDEKSGILGSPIDKVVLALQGKKSKWDNRTGDSDVDSRSIQERTDFLQLLMGQDQKYNSVKKSKYKPTKGDEVSGDYYSSDFTENSIRHRLKSKGYDSFTSGAGNMIINSGGPLGNYTIDKGEDEDGKYISYYDKWDLNPFKEKSILNSLANHTQSAIGIKPPEVYGRVYENEKHQSKGFTKYQSKGKDKKVVDNENLLWDYEEAYQGDVSEKEIKEHLLKLNVTENDTMIHQDKFYSGPPEGFQTIMPTYEARRDLLNKSGMFKWDEQNYGNPKYLEEFEKYRKNDGETLKDLPVSISNNEKFRFFKIPKTHNIKQTGGYTQKYQSIGQTNVLPPRDNVMQYLHNSGRDTNYVNHTMKSIATQESKDNPTQVQIAKYDKDGNPIYGVGKGKFQYEQGKDGAANTAINRAVLFFKDKLDIDLTKNKYKGYENIYNLYRGDGTNTDFTNLSANEQDAIYLAEQIYSGEGPRDNFDILVKGRTTPPTSSEIFNYWGEFHKKKFDRSVTYKDEKGADKTKTIKIKWDKLTTKEKKAEKDKWNSRTKDVHMPTDSDTDGNGVPDLIQRVPVKEKEKEENDYYNTDIFKHQSRGFNNLLEGFPEQGYVAEPDNTRHVLPHNSQIEIEEEEVVEPKSVEELLREGPNVAEPSTTYVAPPVLTELPKYNNRELNKTETKEIEDRATRNQKDNREIVEKQKIKEASQVVIDSFYKKYNPESKEEVEDIQRILIKEGYDLGNFGPKGDGVDGKFGPTTKKSYEEYMMKELNTTQPLYFSVGSRENVCNVDGCAAYVTTEFMNEGFDVNEMGVGGDAWTMLSKIKSKGGAVKFNIFSGGEFKNVENLWDARSKTINASKKRQPKADLLLSGDVVGLVYDNSTHWQDSFEDNKGGTLNTHVGFVSGFEEIDGKQVPVISHNVNGTVYNDLYTNINGGRIAWVASPKNDLTLGFDYSIPETQFDNSEYIDFVDDKMENKILSADDRKNINNTVNTVKNYVPRIKNELNIAIDEDWLIEATLGITGVETGVGTSIPTVANIKKNRKLANTVKPGIALMEGSMFEYIFTGSTGEGSNKISKSSLEETTFSRGITKTKLSGVRSGSKRYYGITNSNIDTDNNKSLAVTIDALTRSYAIYSKRAADNPELNLTEEDIKNMTILTHNQGNSKLIDFGNNPNMTIKEQLIALRDLTKGSTYDVSSSNYRFLPEVVQDYFYTNEFGEKGAESYISKVNRYINREISPLTEEEKEDYSSQVRADVDLIEDEPQSNKSLPIFNQ